MRLIVLSLGLLFLCSCTSLGNIIKDLAGTKKVSPAVAKPAEADTYSENKNFEAYPLPNRRYGRMNRSVFEQEAKVESEAGSLWVNEGQGSYLFSQNQKRLEGDVLNVSLEDQAQEQLQSKANVIAGLLKQREEQGRRRSVASVQEGADAQTPATQAASTTGAGAAAGAKKEDATKDDINVRQVPTRVIATYPDGSYRVKGTKNIMIGGREFQVLVTGLVRSSDIADDTISSAKLLDSKLDIITNRKVQ